MKKLAIYLILSLALVSCYDDYIQDYKYDAVSFPFQTDVRTFIAGEGMKFDFGVVLSGVLNNNRDRVVNYIITDSLLKDTFKIIIEEDTLSIIEAMQDGPDYIKNSVDADADSLKILPSDYYSLSDNLGRFIIKAGSHVATIRITADSAKFVSDTNTLKARYALPLMITSADADSVMATRNFNVIGVKYEHTLFGNYWHGGATLVDTTGGGNALWVYVTTYNTNDHWTVTTEGPTTLNVTGSSNAVSEDIEMQLEIDGGDVTISSVDGATYVVEQDPDEPSSFNQAKLLQDRKIFLNYRIQETIDGKVVDYYASDTLTFRNRIQDGVNVWQDPDPSHYK